MQKHNAFAVFLLLASGLVFAQTPGTLKWSFQTGGWIQSSPAIGADGTVYVGSSDGKLYALHPDGTLKWAFQSGGWVASSPAVGADGTVYVGSYDGKLYALYPSGTLKWSFQAGGWIHSTPAIGPDGTVYVGSSGGKLYAFHPNGTLKWSFQTGDVVDSSPAVGADGSVYVGSYDGKLYALHPNGTLKWSFQTGDAIDSPLAIDTDGTVYVGSNDGKLYAVHPGGTLKWAFDTGTAIWGHAAIGTYGTVYVGSNDGRLYALHANGTLKWSFLTGGRVESSLAIGADETVYVGSYDEKLYALRPNGTQKWSFGTGAEIWAHPTIGADGTVYIGSSDSSIYAFYSDSGGPANSPWPMFQHDARHTARFGSTPHATFSFDSSLLYLPGVSLPDGRVFQAFLQLVPGLSALTFDVTSVARLARGPLPGDATFSFTNSTLEIPVVDLPDGRMFRVVMRLVPRGSFLRFEVTTAQRLDIESQAQCANYAGVWSVNWSEVYCDGIHYAGNDTLVIRPDCSYVADDGSAGQLPVLSNNTFSRTYPDPDGECGTVTETGVFSGNQISGTYSYSLGGGGTFNGSRVN